MLTVQADLDDREIVAQRGVAKNHKPRRIPIDNRLRQIIDSRWGPTI